MSGRAPSPRLGSWLACALLSTCASLQASTLNHWDFTVYLDDKPIGNHRFTVADEQDLRRVDITADFRVRWLLLTLYTYRHDNRETWSGDCLATISALTDDNGTSYRVTGERSDDGFMLAVGDTEERLPDCIRTFSYWDSRILEADALLNAQTGELLPVTIETLGRDPVMAAGRMRDAYRYRLLAGEISIDLWYSPHQEWLALESTTAGGARLRYRLE